MKLEIFVQEEVLSRNKMDVCSIKGTNFFGVKLMILKFFECLTCETYSTKLFDNLERNSSQVQFQQVQQVG